MSIEEVRRDLNLGRVSKNDYSLHKFGYNAVVGTTFETIWPEGGDRTFRTTEATMTVSSSDADDTSAGTGARTVSVYGVDGSWDEVSETATLNGTTGVTLSNSYMIVHRMAVETAGSGNENAGILYVGTGTITAGKPAVVECLVSAGINQSQVAYWPVPNGYSFACTYMQLSDISNQTADAGLYTMPEGGVFNLKFQIIDAGQPIKFDFNPCLWVPEKTICQIRTKVSASTGEIAAGFGGYCLYGKAD